MFEKFLNGELNIPKDSAEKTRPNGFTGMHRHRGHSSVRVLEENMTAAGAKNHKANSFQGAHKILALRAR